MTHSPESGVSKKKTTSRFAGRFAGWRAFKGSPGTREVKTNGWLITFWNWFWVLRLVGGCWYLLFTFHSLLGMTIPLRFNIFGKAWNHKLAAKRSKDLMLGVPGYSSFALLPFSFQTCFGLPQRLKHFSPRCSRFFVPRICAGICIFAAGLSDALSQTTEPRLFRRAARALFFLGRFAAALHPGFAFLFFFLTLLKGLLFFFLFYFLGS